MSTAENGKRTTQAGDGARQVQYLYKLSQRKACRLACINPKVYRQRSNKPARDAALQKRIAELAQSRVRYGYKRIHIMLRREGIHVNHKRVHRLYCLLDMQLKHKRSRRKTAVHYRQQVIRAPVTEMKYGRCGYGSST